ncbi:hypothetical protein JQX13_52445 [Archangium violaceum]|nr:hypothetical protein JQX13_52445 [Archangium violaceum]
MPFPLPPSFGLARHVVPTLKVTGSNMVLGAPGYMAPEQVFGQSEIPPSADIFSLGCVLYECLIRRTGGVAGGRFSGGDAGSRAGRCHGPGSRSASRPFSPWLSWACCWPFPAQRAPTPSCCGRARSPRQAPAWSSRPSSSRATERHSIPICMALLACPSASTSSPVPRVSSG